MTERFFVDTNVLVYMHDSVESAKQAIARECVDRLSHDCSGMTSVQVLNELYVNLIRKPRYGMSPNQAWEIVRKLMKWNPQPLNLDVLLRAREIEGRYRIN